MKSIVENKIIIEGIEIPYIIKYKRIKKIYFRIKEDLVLYISCNKMVSTKYLNTLLENNREAILKMYNKMREKQESNNKILYLGNELKLINYNGKPYIEDDYIYAKDFNEAINYIYSIAFNVFENRVNNFIPLFEDLPNFILKVRKMTSKWGVCNIRSMTVTLNTYLIKKDVHLIDYVIVHELSHFKHMDHSKEFWRCVAKYYPYYKEARKELNYND